MTQDRILTTHVGSLIRPAELTAFLLKQQNGEAIDTAAYEECLRTSVADVVRKQAEIGIDIISDGEFGVALRARAAERLHRAARRRRRLDPRHRRKGSA